MSANRWPYRPEIDGIRAIAVLAVVAFHTAPGWFRGGFFGVDIFFVISGYLITGIIVTSLSDGTFSFADFYSRRIRRIFPALVVVLTASLAFGWLALLPDEYRSLGKHVAGGATFSSNFILLQEVDYFDAASGLKPLLHLWSLAVEEQFYLVWPLVVYWIWKRPPALLAVICAVLVTSFAVHVVLIQRNPAAAFYLPFGRFWELMIGSALACASSSSVVKAPIRFKSAYPRVSKVSVELLSWLGFILMVLPLFLLGEERWVFLPVLGAALVISTGRTTFLSSRFLSLRPLVAVGLISYPLYLWHWPILSFAQLVSAEVPPRLLRALLVSTSFPLAWMTYKYVERPFRARAPTRVSRVGVLCALMAVIGATGYSIYRSDGFASRLADFNASANRITADDQAVVNAEIMDELDKLGDKRQAVAVFGDSHALQLGRGLRLAGVTNLVMISKGTCLPFENIQTYMAKLQPWSGEQIVDTGCQPWVNDAIDKIINAKDIDVVIVAAFYNVYFDGRIPIKAKGSERREASNIILERMKQTIERLVRSGKKVILAVDVPEMSEPCLPRRPYLFKSQGICKVSRAAVADQVAPYEPVLRELQQKFPAVHLYDPRRELCDDNACYAIKDGRYLYIRDGNHLTVAGARMIGMDLKRLLP